MRGICVVLLAFLLSACTAAEPEWKLEVEAPKNALVNPIPGVEENLEYSYFSAGYTLYDEPGMSDDRLLSQADIERALNSKFNLNNFNSLTSLPVYHKTALNEDQMRIKADLMAAALNVEIISYDYYEPLDYHAEDFIIAHETELMSTQSELLAVFKEGNLLIKQNGSIAVELNVPYDEGFVYEYSEQGIKAAAEFFYNQYLNVLVNFEKPIIQVDTKTRLFDGKLQNVYHGYIYNERMSSMTDQLLAQAFQRIDVEFDEKGLTGFTISCLNGEYVGNGLLLDPYEAVVQLQVIDPELNLPMDIRAVELTYAYQDYQYDAIPIYHIYGYDMHGQGVKADVPAILIDSELVYEAPRIYTELHLPLHYNCIYY